jgi:PAS domain S-box-containing protein
MSAPAAAQALKKSGLPREEALNRPSEAQVFLEALVDESLRCVGIADHQGIIRYANPVCRNIYGWEPQEIVGRHFRELYADDQALNRMLTQARLNGRVDNFPIMARHRGGQAVPVEVTLVFIHNEASQLLGSVALIQDARKPQELVRQLQQQELALMRLNRSLELANLELDRANRLKSEFLANTSHELRTPLNAVLGFLRLVLDGLYDNPEEKRDFLQNAYDSARSLLGLINELLDSARIESGKIELNLVRVGVPQVFGEVKKLSRLQAAQKKLRLTFKPSMGDMAVRADAGKLQQVLLNLVANAVKFTHEGEVRVRARAFFSKGHVRFEVQDTGIGIPRELQRDLFQKFVQGDGSPTRYYGGTGLGLAICKNLVEFMGGQIWLTSPGPGRGTTVYFTLPLVSHQPFYWRRGEDRERGFQLKGAKDGPVVLLVEDEPDIIDVMGRILQKNGYRTAYAITADDGLEGARTLKPALVTIDMGLPARPQAALRSGLDLFHALNRDPQTRDIPVLMVTGHEPVLSPALDGIQELPPVLAKPFRVRELLDKVAGLLHGSRHGGKG